MAPSRVSQIQPNCATAAVDVRGNFRDRGAIRRRTTGARSMALVKLRSGRVVIGGGLAEARRVGMLDLLERPRGRVESAPSVAACG